MLGYQVQSVHSRLESSPLINNPSTAVGQQIFFFLLAIGRVGEVMWVGAHRR